MDLRPLCKYGEKCYRENEQHQKQYRHPNSKRKRNNDDNNIEDSKKAKHEKKDKEGLGKTKKAEETSVTINKQEASKCTEENTESDLLKSDKESSSSDDEEPDSLTEPDSPIDIKDNLKQKYKVDFPDDLYLFWKFCQEENTDNPTETFKDSLNLLLIGPFDVLAGKHKGKKNKKGRRPNYLLHWRYYYDPPEFTTLMSGDKKSQFHLGYYRDDPNSMPDFVAANSAGENGLIKFVGENLFSAIKYYMEDKLKCKENTKKTLIEKQLKALVKFCKKNDVNLDIKTDKSKKRDKKVVCKTFHGAGIVVPVDENEVGYRPVPETPADLKKMFKRIVESKNETERDKNLEPLQELITYIQFANDECDYGEGLELGLDLFTYGGEVFHSTILTLLPLAYQLLNRSMYSEIIETHLKHRKHTSDLSQLHQ